LANAAPAYRAFGGKLAQTLRYGENPHQNAAFYRAPEQRFGVATARPGAGQGALLQQHQRHRRGL
jgi:phosphoribosylaminoimidazolecarboxamide formyltransferase/IMP cyclohydrolase